jgi:hypothetical protein
VGREGHVQFIVVENEKLVKIRGGSVQRHAAEMHQGALGFAVIAAVSPNDMSTARPFSSSARSTPRRCTAWPSEAFAPARSCCRPAAPYRLKRAEAMKL